MQFLEYIDLVRSACGIDICLLIMLLAEFPLLPYFFQAKFLAVLIIIPCALDFLVHDFVLMPFLDRLALIRNALLSCLCIIYIGTLTKRNHFFLFLRFLWFYHKLAPLWFNLQMLIAITNTLHQFSSKVTVAEIRTS